MAESLIKAGVSVSDSSRIDIRGEIAVGKGSFIDVNTVFEGSNKIGTGVHIGPGSLISNSIIKNDVIIHANTVIEDSIVGSDCEIGPFARIRGGTEMQNGYNPNTFEYGQSWQNRGDIESLVKTSSIYPAEDLLGSLKIKSKNMKSKKKKRGKI